MLINKMMFLVLLALKVFFSVFDPFKVVIVH